MKFLTNTIYVSMLFVMVFCAGSVSAQVVINEIAWQGYLGDANNEWIELYNSGSATVNLDGWLLQASDGTPSINLSGLTISPDSFLLLERTDDSSVPEESADLLYTGALSNSGESLTLKNADGATQDSASFAGGWLDVSDANQTLAKINGSWSVGDPTPKDYNQENQTDDDTSDSENNEPNESDSENSQISNSGSSSKEELEYDSRKVVISSEKNGYVGDPVVFSSYVRDFDGSELRKGFYIWNMGDGNVLYKNTKDEFNYTYYYPGEYVVTLRYNKEMFGKGEEKLEPDAIDEYIINISKQSIEISNILPNGTVTFKNVTKQTIDLSGWKISNNEHVFIVPLNTKVRAGKTITFANTVTQLTHNPISLSTPNNALVDFGSHHDFFEKKSSVAVVSNVTTKPKSQEEFTPLSEQEVQAIEMSFADTAMDNQEASVRRSDTKNSNTVIILLFIVILFLTGFLVWYLLLDKKTNMVVEGYEIVED